MAPISPPLSKVPVLLLSPFSQILEVASDSTCLEQNLSSSFLENHPLPNFPVPPVITVSRTWGYSWLPTTTSHPKTRKRLPSESSTVTRTSRRPEQLPEDTPQSTENAHQAQMGKAGKGRYTRPRTITDFSPSAGEMAAESSLNLMPILTSSPPLPQTSANRALKHTCEPTGGGQRFLSQSIKWLLSTISHPV